MRLSALDYAVPEEMRQAIKIGQLVKIPFRAGEEFGILREIGQTAGSAETTRQLKPLTELVGREPLLSPAQMAWLEEMSAFYHTPLGFLLKMNLPPLGKRNLTALAACPGAANRPGRVGTDAQAALPFIGRPKPTLFIYAGAEEKKDYLKKILRKETRTAGQALILTPEAGEVKKIYSLLPTDAKRRTITITAARGAKEEFADWLKIFSGEKTIVIGTRSALFLPWRALRCIILDDEANPDHKSRDMAPRFHARDAVLFLARHHGAAVHLLTHTPAVETYYFARRKIYGGQTAIKRLPGETDIVNMKDEKKRGNYGCLSEALLGKIRAAAGDVFLFVNRRGAASHISCRDCGHVMRCAQCATALSYHSRAGTLECKFCRTVRTMTDKCQKCGGANISMFGLGAETVETELKKTPYADRTVIRLDSASGDIPPDGGQKIIVGTQFAWPRLNWQKLSLAAFVDADISLFLPEYRASEELFLFLRSARYNLRAGAELLAQTSHPEHPAFNGLSNPENFYAKELAGRRALDYPPFRYLLRLFCAGREPAATAKKAEAAAEQIRQLTNSGIRVKISGPLPASPERQKGRYWQVILLKIPYESYKKDIKKILSILPDDWKADPNPKSILTV